MPRLLEGREMTEVMMRMASYRLFRERGFLCCPLCGHHLSERMCKGCNTYWWLDEDGEHLTHADFHYEGILRVGYTEEC